MARVKFCSKAVDKSYVEYMPIIIMAGSGVGTCIGSYHGYQESKKYTYGECICSTVWFGWVGWAAGYVTTIFCPIVVPIVIVATIARQMEPVQDPEKKESEIYTLQTHPGAKHPSELVVGFKEP
jgi:hypothetical protein